MHVVGASFVCAVQGACSLQGWNARHLEHCAAGFARVPGERDIAGESVGNEERVSARVKVRRVRIFQVSGIEHPAGTGALVGPPARRGWFPIREGLPVKRGGSPGERPGSAI